jgi:hypothetical protein
LEYISFWSMLMMLIHWMKAKKNTEGVLDAKMEVNILWKWAEKKRSIRSYLVTRLQDRISIQEYLIGILNMWEKSNIWKLW